MGDSGMLSEIQSLSSMSLASESMTDVREKGDGSNLDISLGEESGLGDSTQTPSTPVFSAIPNIPSVQVRRNTFFITLNFKLILLHITSNALCAIWDHKFYSLPFFQI